MGVAVRQPISQEQKPGCINALEHRNGHGSLGAHNYHSEQGCAEHGAALKCWRDLHLSACSSLEPGFSLLTVLSGDTAAFSCQKDERRASDYFSTGTRLGPFHFLL